MSRIARFLTIFLAGIVLLAGYVVYDWYRFATASKLDPNQGVYGNDHLEVFIAINEYMPGGMRKWACKTLLDREAEVMRGHGALPPHTCQAGYDTTRDMSMSEGMLYSFGQSAATMAKAKGATAEQQTQVSDCVQAEIKAKLTPEQTTALQELPDGATILAVNEYSQVAVPACLAKAGL